MGFERKYPLPEAAEDQSKLTFKQGQLELYYDLEEQLRNKKGEYVSPHGVPLDKQGIPVNEPAPGRCSMPVTDQTAYAGSLCRIRVSPGKTCPNHPVNPSEKMRQEEAKQAEFRAEDFELRVAEEMKRDDLLDHTEMVARLRVLIKDMLTMMARSDLNLSTSLMNSLASAIDSLGKSSDRARASLRGKNITPAEARTVLGEIRMLLVMTLDDDGLYKLFHERLTMLTQRILDEPQHFLLVEIPDDFEFEGGRKFADELVRLGFVPIEALGLFSSEPEPEEQEPESTVVQTVLR